MSTRALASLGRCAATAAVIWSLPIPIAGQASSTIVKKPIVSKKWTPPRTPWGDPDLSGTFTNKAELGTPVERPAEFEGRRIEDISPEEMAAILRQRQKDVLEEARPTGRDDPHAPVHWSDRYDVLKGSRPWLVVDPPDGKIPPLTPEAQKWGNAAATRGFDSWLDRTLWERCITRGLPGSMWPNILGNSFEIIQAPGLVAIRYETIHETRLIPLDGRPLISPAIRQYMGDARGHWVGDTLVVESTNFKNRPGIGQNGNGQIRSEALRLTERFTRSAPDKVMWTVTLDDPKTWTRPWTFAMPLTMDDNERIFEFACHEGNYGLRNVLSGARWQEEKAGSSGGSR